MKEETTRTFKGRFGELEEWLDCQENNFSELAWVEITIKELNFTPYK